MIIKPAIRARPLIGTAYTAITVYVFAALAVTAAVAARRLVVIPAYSKKAMQAIHALVMTAAGIPRIPAAAYIKNTCESVVALILCPTRTANNPIGAYAVRMTVAGTLQPVATLAAKPARASRDTRGAHAIRNIIAGTLQPVATLAAKSTHAAHGTRGAHANRNIITSTLQSNAALLCQAACAPDASVTAQTFCTL